MTIGRAFPDLLTPLSSAASVEEGLAQTLGRLVELTGAAAGAPGFTPPHEAANRATAGGATPPPGVRARVAGAVETTIRRGGALARAGHPRRAPGDCRTLIE